MMRISAPSWHKVFRCFNAAAFMMALALWIVPTAAPSQTLRVGPGAPTDEPIIFQAFHNNCVSTASSLRCAADLGGKPEFGTHVDIDPSNFGYLVIFIPDGTRNSQGIANGVFKRLFPLPVHNAILDVPAERGVSSLSDATVSLDGRSVLLTLHHDITDRHEIMGTNRGADIYQLFFDQLLMNPNNTAWNPETDMAVRRLTQQFTDPNLYALNRNTAALTNPNRGVVNSGPAEILNAQGQPELVFASSRLRIFNSNLGGNRQNLFKADYRGNALGNVNLFEYFGTTSVVTPAPVRNGISFSYNVPTDRDGGAFNRHWRIEVLTSQGLQQPLMGYGYWPTTAFHGQTAANPGSGLPGDDLHFGVAYYSGSGNNQGYGGILVVPERDRGTNQEIRRTVNGVSYVDIVRQQGEYALFGNVSLQEDNDSGWDDNRGRWTGKAGTPYALANGTLYFSHCTGACNSRVESYTGGDGRTYHHDYRARIARVSNYTQANQDILNSTLVVEDATDTYSLVRPLLLHSASRKFLGAPVPAQREFASRYPYGKLGTSNLINSDVRHINCFEALRGGYAPQSALDPATDAMHRQRGFQTRVALQVWDPNLTLEQACSGFPNSSEQVGWLAYYQTSDKTNMGGYLHAAEPGQKKPELHTLLGIVKVFNEQGRAADDTSAEALVPSKIPINMIRLHRQTGLRTHQSFRWLDVNHGETRHDCGGCHGHTAFNAANVIPFEQTHASRVPAKDLVNQTIDIDYDSNCRPFEKVVPAAAVRPPVWEDVWPGFVQNCASCHSTGGSGAAVFVVNTSNARATLDALGSKRYVDRKPAPKEEDVRIHAREVAMRQQVWWAARGMRMDGMSNDAFRSRSDAYGRMYVYSDAHNNLGLCNGTNQEAARWVLKLGQFLDHGAFSQTDFPRGLPSAGSGVTSPDLYHPTFAVLPTACANPRDIEVVPWDDSGSVARIEIYRNEIGSGNLIGSLQGTAAQPLNNGQAFAFSLASLGANEKAVFVVSDAFSNRQFFQTDLNKLTHDCQIADNSGGGSGPGSIFLNMRSATATVNGRPSYRITMTIDIPAATTDLTVSIPGTRRGAGSWQIAGYPLDITYDDPYSDQTLAATVRSVTNRYAEIVYDVPPEMLAASGPTMVMHQALVIETTTQRVYGKSAPIELQLGTSPGGGGGGGSGGGGGGSGSGSGGQLRRSFLKSSDPGSDMDPAGPFGCQASSQNPTAALEWLILALGLAALRGYRLRVSSQKADSF